MIKCVNRLHVPSNMHEVASEASKNMPSKIKRFDIQKF